VELRGRNALLLQPGTVAELTVRNQPMRHAADVEPPDGIDLVREHALTVGRPPPPTTTGGFASPAWSGSCSVASLIHLGRRSRAAQRAIDEQESIGLISTTNSKSLRLAITPGVS
jgi:hypothetical protein